MTTRPRRAIAPLAVSLAVLTAAASAASAQVVDVAPTFQGSVDAAFTELPQARFQAYGVMVGLKNIGPWSPNVWFQRYQLESDCIGTFGSETDCRTDGWTVSVGPALQFIDNDRWSARLVTQVGVDSRVRTDFTGGAGVHVGVKLGAFQPTAFSRMDVFRGVGYTTVGVGLRFRISSGATTDDPEWYR